MNSENLKPCLRIRNTDFDFAIEAARTSKCGIEYLGNICRTDDDDLSAGHETIHQAEKLCYNALFDLATHFGALGGHRVNLVDEENRRRMACSFFEDLAELGLAFTIELPHDLRAVEVNEMHTALSSHSAGEKRLTRTRW